MLVMFVYRGVKGTGIVLQGEICHNHDVKDDKIWIIYEYRKVITCDEIYGVINVHMKSPQHIQA